MYSLYNCVKTLIIMKYLQMVFNIILTLYHLFHFHKVHIKTCKFFSSPGSLNFAMYVLLLISAPVGFYLLVAYAQRWLNKLPSRCSDEGDTSSCSEDEAVQEMLANPEDCCQPLPVPPPSPVLPRREQHKPPPNKVSCH